MAQRLARLRRSWRFFSRHLGLGYGPILLVVDLVLGLGIAWDLAAYRRLGLQIDLATLTTVYEESGAEELWQAAVLVAVLVLLIPMVIAVLRVVTGLRPFGIQPPKWWHGGPVVTLHLLASILIAAVWAGIPTLQVLAGAQWFGGEPSYAFRPISGWILGPLSSHVAPLLVTALLGAVGVFGNRYVEEGDIPPWFREYYSRCVLSDPNGDFRPVHEGNKLNFNIGGRAPEIVYVRHLSNKLWADWQARIPGSETSQQAHDEVEEDCRDLLNVVLGPETMLDAGAVQYYSGTGDAIEILLGKIAGEAAVIVSPYEHPNTIRVAERHARLVGRDCHAVRLGPDEHCRSRKQQAARILERLKLLMAGPPTHAILLLSEVCYMTGTRTPVEELMGGVKELIGNHELTVIMDGTYAVGNGRPVTIPEDCNHYLFCGERWLFAPDPLTIVISQATEAGREQASPLSFAARETSEASVRALLGLRCSLQFIQEMRPETLWAHAFQARSYFLRHAATKFVPVCSPEGREEPSLMVTLRPRHRWRWKEERLSEGLGRYFEGGGVYVRVLNIETGNPWIRVSFAHFLSFQEIQTLVSLLNGAVLEVKRPAGIRAAAAGAPS